MKYLNQIFILGLIFFYYSCTNNIPKEVRQTLKLAGNNRNELEKVINYYKQSKDSLKLQAAYFLIANMPYHSWEIGYSQFEAAFDSIAKYPFIDKRREVFETILDSISLLPTLDTTQEMKDIIELNADFLIANIELAFEAWYKYPKDKRGDFATFCNYILPYRNANEPVEPGTRKKLMEEYYWVFDSLNANVSLKNVADQIITNFHYQNLTSIRNYYPFPLSISQYERSKIGLCQDEVNYFIHLFRALGIASFDESVLHWGNHHTSGHSWLRLQYGKEIYCENNLIEVYKKESIPKVNRRTFAINKTIKQTLTFFLDVTSEYKETININIENIFQENAKSGFPVLCIFDALNNWIKVIEGEELNNQLVFRNVGTNVLYLPSFYTKGKIKPAYHPIFIDSSKNIHIYHPLELKEDSIVLHRKAGLVTPRNKTKRQWIDSLRFGIFQGSNDIGFKNAQTLAKIRKMSSTQPQILEVKCNKTYKYIRFYANKHETYLALLELYNKQGKRIKCKLSETSKIPISWKEGALDEDQLTFYGGKGFSLVLELDFPQTIGNIRYQARNDDNHIDQGDTYELFYWHNTTWTSLGVQLATDTLLVYHEVPQNALFWLRNLSKGKEENPFIIDNNKKQFFPGFCKD